MSGLGDPKEMFISVTELVLMCPSFGRTREKVRVLPRAWQIQELL